MSTHTQSVTSLADSVSQKARRRRETLFKKASEYCSECAADIQLVLRMRKTGQMYILTSNSEGWPLSEDQLVRYLTHYINRKLHEYLLHV
jgi:SRF-type transcription factor (DNA-binding and dimerisation domain).